MSDTSIVIAKPFLNRRSTVVRTITKVIGRINKIRIVTADGSIGYEQLGDFDNAFLEQYPDASPRVAVINKVLEEEDVTRYAVRCTIGESAEPCYVLYNFNVADSASDDENVDLVVEPADANVPIQAHYPTFSVTSDPEVISDISLAGSHLQRFLPILIQGYISLKDELEYASTISEEQISAANLLGEAYADVIVTALTTPESVQSFNTAFGPDCYGFAVERIGPVIVDTFNAPDQTTRSLISVQVQTSFIQDS